MKKKESASYLHEGARSSFDMQGSDEAPSIPAAFFQMAGIRNDAVLFRKRLGRKVESFTWSEIESLVIRFGVAMIRRGFAPGDCAALMADNGPLWAVADLAIQAAGGVTVPIFCTATDDQIRHIVNDCKARLFLAGSEKHLRAADLSDLPPGSRPEAVVIDEPSSRGGEAGRLETFLGAPPTDDEIEALKERTASLGRDGLCSIIYTSGTSGPSKGVLLTHGNILANLKGCRLMLEIGHNDVFLSILPMSHSFERTAGFYSVILSGAQIHFARSPGTLSKDIVEAKPTMVMMVPRFLEKMRQKILTAMESTPGIAGALGRAALRVRLRLARSVAAHEKPSLCLRLTGRAALKLIGPSVQKKFGGRIRAILSGGAPLSLEVWILFHALGITVMEGYGLTETSPVIACNPPDRIKPGSVGKPITGVDVKIAGDGEILAGGPCVMKGYHNLTEATAEAIDDQGYLHTGDVGHLDDDGYLFITDRKKDIIVSASGKNIAPQNVESALCLDPLVEFACVFGDKENFLVAILSPDQETMAERKLDGGFGDPETLARFQEAVDRANENLAPYERIFRFHLAETPFTTDGGEITTTLKVKRRFILDKYGDVIEKLFR